jgi:glyoxylase-like metal-dependent hydrolase (beta-lactamase superfamily II)
MSNSTPREIAPGVERVEVGKGMRAANVYFVRSGPSWTLIDAAWPKCGQLIREAAESLYGANTCPAAILLTHLHPDHSGSALELARLWSLPVYVHPCEMPLAADKLIPEYANPLDRWIIAPLMKLMPRRTVESKPPEPRLADVVRALEPGAAVPGLPDWECVPTPGHTPGHVAFFRRSDGVLITGDALLTVNPNSLWDFLLKKQRVSGPPYISTWNWQAAKKSVATLARLDPKVLASGHGLPMTGTGTAQDLRAFSDHFSASKTLFAVRAAAPRRPGQG